MLCFLEDIAFGHFSINVFLQFQLYWEQISKKLKHYVALVISVLTFIIQ